MAIGSLVMAKGYNGYLGALKAVSLASDLKSQQWMEL